VVDPLSGGLHGLGGKAASVDAAIDFALEEAGGFENAKMLGDGGERKGERLGELGDRGFTLREAGENGAAGGVGECGESGVERGIGIVNHTVYYCRDAFACQANFWDPWESNGGLGGYRPVPKAPRRARARMG
jgi:hypothetical protein